ncbi:hypothetical protein [Daejeonia sp. YH14]|uniref:hypothetical protein n=1 Tax=Daejeonia sp. YH14 TaxID=3439042 RepID=UPI003F49938D
MKTVYALGALMLLGCQKNKSGDIRNLPETDTLQQKNGEVISFRTFPGTLIRLNRDQTAYTENYSKRLYKIAECYIDKTQQQLVKYQKENPKANLGFSVEENDWEDVKYTQIGIFNRVGSNISTLQWLFYNPRSQELFEFDLHRKKLVLFPMK